MKNQTIEIPNIRKKTSRIVIEIPTDLHCKIKGFSAIQGQSMKEFIINATCDKIESQEEKLPDCKYQPRYASLEDLYANCPNKETVQSIKDIEAGVGLNEYASLEDFFKQMELECSKE